MAVDDGDSMNSDEMVDIADEITIPSPALVKNNSDNVAEMQRGITIKLA